MEVPSAAEGLPSAAVAPPREMGPLPNDAGPLPNDAGPWASEGGEPLLFDLAKDPGESNDLSESMPELADTMRKKLKKYLKSVCAEDIRDMRAARRAELLEYKARARRNIARIRQSIEDSPSKREKDAFKKKLQHERKRMKAHDEGLNQLDRSRLIKSW